MTKRAKILAVVGFAAAVAVPLTVYAATRATKSATRAEAGGYICPLTGKELPCPNCCPLNKRK
jgi:hypothetical protein